MKKIIKQSLSFFAISGLGWLIDFTIFTLITNFFDLNVFVANIISSIPAITFVFFTSTKKVFEGNIGKLDIKYKYLIYVFYQIILLLFISKFGQFLFDGFHEKFTNYNLIYNNFKMIIKIFITPFTMILNYVTMKVLIEKL